MVVAFSQVFPGSRWTKAKPLKQALDPAPAEDTGQVSTVREGSRGPHRHSRGGPCGLSRLESCSFATACLSLGCKFQG